ncbi:hypothetical protein, partial [Microvirga pudoricolor]|uniref:hypothetical protein n=1 Tax=Microvirga pudoricolor TaxID=2778729 RepID=UPI0019503DFC
IIQRMIRKDPPPTLLFLIFTCQRAGSSEEDKPGGANSSHQAMPDQENQTSQSFQRQPLGGRSVDEPDLSSSRFLVNTVFEVFSNPVSTPIRR